MYVWWFLVEAVFHFLYPGFALGDFLCWALLRYLLGNIVYFSRVLKQIQDINLKIVFDIV